MVEDGRKEHIDMSAPTVPWDWEMTSDIHEHLGFSCGPFSVMAAMERGPNLVRDGLDKLSKPYRGWMNPTQMRELLALLELPVDLIQRVTREMVGCCVARVQYQRVSDDIAPFGGQHAGWRNVMESYQRTHYVAVRDGWVYCTATNPDTWLTLDEWKECQAADDEYPGWHFTHRWFRTW